MENSSHQHIAKKPRVSERDVDRLLGNAADDPFVKLIAMKHFNCGNDEVVYDIFQDEQNELFDAWVMMCDEPTSTSNEKKEEKKNEEDEMAAIEYMDIEEVEK